MVYVEEGTITDLNLPSAKNIFQFNSQTDKESLTGKVDFIVTLGGDGTLIHASSLFQVGIQGRSFGKMVGEADISEGVK